MLEPENIITTYVYIHFYQHFAFKFVLMMNDCYLDWRKAALRYKMKKHINYWVKLNKHQRCVLVLFMKIKPLQASCCHLLKKAILVFFGLLLKERYCNCNCKINTISGTTVTRWSPTWNTYLRLSSASNTRLCVCLAFWATCWRGWSFRGLILETRSSTCSSAPSHSMIRMWFATRSSTSSPISSP